MFSAKSMGVSRRGLLRSAAVTTVAAPALSNFNAAPASAEQVDSNTLAGSRVTFSIIERNRRWAAVRSVMASPKWNLDAIVAGSPVVDAGGDQLPVGFDRYLAQLGGAEDPGAFGPVVFPRDASQSVQVILNDGGSIPFWNARGLNQWTADGSLVLTSGDAVTGVASRLSALGAKRVGVAELAGTRYNPLGTVPWGYFEALQAALPQVAFMPIERWEVNPADPGPLQAAAMVKGIEEQQVIRTCVRATEIGIQALIKAVQQGAATQAEMWYPGYFAMLAETGETPVRLSIGLDVAANSRYGSPTADHVSEGQIVSQEISAKVQGYGAQINHSFFIGNSRTPGYQYYAAAATVAIQAILDAIEFINKNPGAMTGDLVRDYVAKAQARGAVAPSGVVMLSSGVGALSRPRIGPSQLGTGQDDNIKIVPGMAFDFKSSITLQRDILQDVGPQNRAVQVGENIIVTEHGAVRAGTRSLVPLRTKG